MKIEDLLTIIEPITKIAVDSYVSVSVLNKHYIDTISELTGKDKTVIIEELNSLIPEQKKKTEEVFLKIIAQLRTKE